MLASSLAVALVSLAMLQLLVLALDTLAGVIALGRSADDGGWAAIAALVEAVLGVAGLFASGLEAAGLAERGLAEAASHCHSSRPFTLICWQFHPVLSALTKTGAMSRAIHSALAMW